MAMDLILQINPNMNTKHQAPFHVIPCLTGHTPCDCSLSDLKTKLAQIRQHQQSKTLAHMPSCSQNSI